MAVVLASGLVSPDVRAAEQRQAASQAKEPTVHAIVIDPTMPSTIYVGTDDFDANESNNLRAASITLTFDPAAQLKRLQDIYEQGGMGEEQYKQERDFVLEFVTNGQER